MPHGVEDYLFNQGILGIVCLICMGVIAWVVKQWLKCHKEILAVQQERLDFRVSMLDRYSDSIEKAAESNNKLADVVEERNKSTQILSAALHDFSLSFEHRTQMDKVYMQQAMEKLADVRMILDNEVKAVTAIGDSVRALAQLMSAHSAGILTDGRRILGGGGSSGDIG